MNSNTIYPFLTIGLILILLGIAFIILPILAKHLPSLQALQRLPPILIYVYKSENFVFVTSPILIIITLAFILWQLLKA